MTAKLIPSLNPEHLRSPGSTLPPVTGVDGRGTGEAYDPQAPTTTLRALGSPRLLPRPLWWFRWGRLTIRWDNRRQGA
jgi:hypothetical protein